MPHANLTARFIAAAVCPDGKRKIEFIDKNLEGFFIEVIASGVKTYYQRYIDAHKRQRQIRIGRVGIVSLDEARKRAVQIKADVSLGKNPKQDSEELKEIPLLKDFALNRYLPYVRQAKRSWTTDEIIIRRHLVPALGELYLDEIAPAHIIRMMADMRAAGLANGTCNRPVIILRYMLNLAADWGIPRLDRNPAKKVQLLEEPHRQRFLSAAETRALIEALREDENQLAAQAIELLLLTGGRRNEMDTRNNHDFRAVIGLVAGTAARDATGRVGLVTFRPMFFGFSAIFADFRRAYPVAAHRSWKIRRSKL